MLTVHIGPYTIEAIEGHKRGPGKASLTNFQYHFLVKDKLSNLGIWRHVNVVPQCHEMIRAYRSRILAEDPHAYDPPKSSKSKRDVVAQSSWYKPHYHPPSFWESLVITIVAPPPLDYTYFIPAGLRSSIVRRWHMSWVATLMSHFFSGGCLGVFRGVVPTCWVKVGYSIAAAQQLTSWLYTNSGCLFSFVSSCGSTSHENVAFFSWIKCYRMRDVHGSETLPHIEVVSFSVGAFNQ